jgi:hypothetical protein
LLRTIYSIEIEQLHPLRIGTTMQILGLSHAGHSAMRSSNQELARHVCVARILRTLIWGSLFDTLKQSRRVACSICSPLLNSVQRPLNMQRRSTSSTLNFQPQTRVVAPSPTQIPMQDAAPNYNEPPASAIAELRLERASAHQRRGHACHACHACIHSSAPNQRAFPTVSTALALPRTCHSR